MGLITHHVISGTTKCRIPGHSWVLAKTTYKNLDTLHRKTRGTNLFLSFRCNDPECDAQMDILWKEAAEALLIT